MEKSHLKKTINEIENRISEISASGEVAPSGVWISKYVVPKNKGKKYYYYRLMEETNNRSCSGKTQGKFKQYLGKKNSSKYNQWVSAISRRNRIKSLIRQKQMLEIQLQKLEAQEQVSSGNLTQANSQNPYSELHIKDFSHLQQIITSIETQINELNYQFQCLINYAIRFQESSA
jgi:hypothetical protein